MNEQVNLTMRPFVNALPCLSRSVPADMDDLLEKERSKRYRDYERRRAAHPDPHDPDHPDELEEA